MGVLLRALPRLAPGCERCGSRRREGAWALAAGGNFRLLQRLFDQITRIMEINKLRTITSEVIEAARESLVIGTA